MLPADVHRIWWPQTVWRPITEYGMSLRPSSSCATVHRGAEGRPAVRRAFTTMIWLSKSNVDLPGGLVLPVQEVDVQRAVGRDLRDRELILVAVVAAACRLEGAARMRAGDLLGLPTTSAHRRPSS